jgi:hypothetical protein
MRTRPIGWRIARGLAAPLVLAGMFTGSGSGLAFAGSCDSWSGVQPQNPGTSVNELFGVTVISPCDAWVAGFSSSGRGNQTLIEHWNGSAWTVVPSPDPGSVTNFLDGIRAVSPSNIWAAGGFNDGGVSDQTLIVHWDGKSWRQVESPSPGDSADLNAVRPVFASSVWAVGSFSKGGKQRALIMCLTGTRPGQRPVRRLCLVASRRLGRRRLHQRRCGEDPDPALGWPPVAAAGEPRSWDHKRPVGYRGDVGSERVGGRVRREWHRGSDSRPALERTEMVRGGQP